MISVAIDGPAGAGKSTLARRLAADFGYIYVDTGAMFRTIGLYALRAGKDPKDNEAVNALLPNITLEFAFIEGEQHIYLNGEDVSTAIRTEEVGMAASAVGANPAVRAFLLEMQRDMARTQNILMDGRDIGTVVLPNATVKIFLTASPEARATRRWKEYQQKGIRKWKNENMVKRARDTKSLQVLEMLQGDEHTFDLWVMYKAKNGKEFPIRPKLVCWIDTRSRMIFGDLICKDADSQILKESLIKLIYVDLPGQVPRYLYIDNGKDYTSRQMTGVDRKDRHNQAAKDEFFDMEFDRPTRGFYHDMGIEDEHISMPYEPWTKGQIERSFGTAIEKFSKKFASYTGTLTGSKTDAKVPKEIKKMAEQGKLLTMEEFYEEWKKYKEKYINRTHRGLRNAGEEFKKPLEVFENEERYIKAAPPRSFAVMALMKSEEALLNNVGIKRFGYYYMDDELLPYINQKIHIKVDPYDVTSIYCINNKGGLICQAQCQELLQFGKVSDETLQEHRKMQRRQLRAVREELEEANRPFDGDEDAAHKGVVGGVKLTIGKDGKKSKVVAMPTDETYRKNKEFRKPNECEYMNSQAKKALERLQKMGGA